MTELKFSLAGQDDRPTSSRYFRPCTITNVPVQYILYQFRKNCTNGKNCTTTYTSVIVNLTTASLNGVKCPRHPGASTIGSQLLDETAPMAGKSWQPSYELPRRREEGHLSQWYNIQWKKGRVGGYNQETTLKEWWRDNKHDGPTALWTTEDCWLHRLINTSSKHALGQVHKWTLQNARESRPLTDALAQVPHKKLLGMKELWNRRRHWCVCKRILQTFFVVNKCSLLLTLLNYI